MHLPLPYYPLIAHWLPGFVFLTIISFPFLTQYICSTLNGAVAAIILFVFTVSAFIVGQIFDAFRNSILEEYVFDKYCIDFDWIAFALNKNEKLENLYFVYYAADINLITSFILGSIWMIVHPFYKGLSCGEIIVIILCIAISIFLLGKDAKSLRKEMLDIINAEKKKI